MAWGLRSIVPAVGWLRSYHRGDLPRDLSAGLIVGVMLVPQGMAYAMLAGLPPVVGLYASLAPVAVYALFGSSRHLAVGPVAIVSLVVLAKCSTLATPGSPEYVRIVLLLCLMVGALEVLLGLLRMGFVVNFLSHAVISGFTSAAAILIGLSQLKHLLGVPLSSHETIVSLVPDLARHLRHTHPATLAVGLASLAALVALRRILPRFPAPIAVVAVSIVLSYALGLAAAGVRTVGVVPSGLPAPTAPALDIQVAGSLLPAAVTIVFVGFIESISVAQLIATKERYRIDANQELKALGLANIAAALLSGYPVTGGFSRTAVNHQAGARTGLASLVTAATVLLTVLLLTPLFRHLPNAVLAAIVVVAVVGLIDLRTPRRLFGIKRASGGCLVLTFVGTLALGVEAGVLLGVAFSLGLFVWRSAHPHTAEVGFVEEEGVFRNIARYPEARTYPGVMILRIDASLYFANMRFLEDLLRERLHQKPDTRWVLLDFSGVNDIDAVAVETLERLMEGYGEHGIAFAFAGAKGPVRDVLARAGWTDRFGDRVRYTSLTHALQALLPPDEKRQRDDRTPAHPGS